MEVAVQMRPNGLAPAETPSAQAKSDGKPDIGALRDAVETVNQAMVWPPPEELRVRIDPDTRRLIVQLVQRETNEVLRQVPSDYVLELAKQVKAAGTYA
jgi:flagellar protein FlaG